MTLETLLKRLASIDYLRHEIERASAAALDRTHLLTHAGLELIYRHRGERGAAGAIRAGLK
jgi:hypothetical protein